jgi:hypothetical protein
VPIPIGAGAKVDSAPATTKAPAEDVPTKAVNDDVVLTTSLSEDVASTTSLSEDVTGTVAGELGDDLGSHSLRNLFFLLLVCCAGALFYYMGGGRYIKRFLKIGGNERVPYQRVNRHDVEP